MKKIIGAVALLVFGFVAGVLTSAVLHLGSPIVTVEVKNASTKEINSLRLTHEHGLVEVRNLQVGASRTVRFYAPGESSYELHVAFSDGKEIKSNGRYVEAGNKMNETISDTEIKTDHHFFRY